MKSVLETDSPLLIWKKPSLPLSLGSWLSQSPLSRLSAPSPTPYQGDGTVLVRFLFDACFPATPWSQSLLCWDSKRRKRWFPVT